MQIRPTSGIQSTSKVQLQTNNTTREVSTSQTIPTDQLEISVEAQLQVRASANDIRADRVADLKAQIASGQYATTEKLDAAVSRMLDEIG